MLRIDLIDIEKQQINQILLYEFFNNNSKSFFNKEKCLSNNRCFSQEIKLILIEILIWFLFFRLYWLLSSQIKLYQSFYIIIFFIKAPTFIYKPLKYFFSFSRAFIISILKKMSSIYDEFKNLAHQYKWK